MTSLEASGSNGQIEIDGDWLTIKRKGLRAKMYQGFKGDKRVPLANVTSVQLKNASIVTEGYIQFTFVGGQEAKAGLMQASSDENTVTFTKKHAPEFQAVREYVENYIQQRLNPQQVATASPSSDPLDQLKKLADLRDAGVVSPEEFEAKKKQLLGL